MILAGDIGGTNTRLALFTGSPAKPEPVVIEVVPSAGRSGPSEAIQEFLSKQDYPQLETACFGIAGPVRNGISQTPNLPWIVNAAELARDLNLKAVRLVNDLEVNAHGIAVLQPQDFETLNPGAPDAAGNRVLIAAGTGLGEAGMLADGNEYRPYPSEGGHADFAARNEIEIALLLHLTKRFGRVSYERVLSGPGLFNIYQFLRDTGRGEEPSWLADELRQKDPSAVIASNAMKGSSDLCIRALDIFVSVYGAEAGNLALKGMATGGVFLGGGIAPKILPKLKEPAFMEAFTAKGRVAAMLEAIPVRVILNDQTALLGAGRLAMLM